MSEEVPPEGALTPPRSSTAGDWPSGPHAEGQVGGILIGRAGPEVEGGEEHRQRDQEQERQAREGGALLVPLWGRRGAHHLGRSGERLIRGSIGHLLPPLGVYKRPYTTYDCL